MRVYDAVIIIIKSLKKAHSVRIALEHKEKSTGKKNPSTAFNPIHTRKWSLCWACFHFIHSNNENLFGFFRRWSFLRFFLFVTSLHSNNTLFIPPAAGRMKTVYITQYHPRGDGSCGSDRYNALGQRRKKNDFLSLSFAFTHCGSFDVISIYNINSKTKWHQIPYRNYWCYICRILSNFGLIVACVLESIRAIRAIWQ